LREELQKLQSTHLESRADFDRMIVDYKGYDLKLLELAERESRVGSAEKIASDNSELKLTVEYLTS
jgi:hypothetical protein